MSLGRSACESLAVFLYNYNSYINNVWREIAVIELFDINFSTLFKINMKIYPSI